MAFLMMVLGFSGWVRAGGAWTNNVWLLSSASEAGGWTLDGYVHHTASGWGWYGWGQVEQYVLPAEPVLFAFPTLGMWAGSTVQVFAEGDLTWASRPEYPRSLTLTTGFRGRPGELRIQRVVSFTDPLNDWRAEVIGRATWWRQKGYLTVEGFAGGTVRTLEDTLSGGFSPFRPGGPWMGGMDSDAGSRTRVTGGRVGARFWLGIERSRWTRITLWGQAQAATGDALTVMEFTRDPENLLLGSPYAYHALEGGIRTVLDLPGHVQVRGRGSVSRRWYLNGRQDLSWQVEGGVERALRIRWSVFLEGRFFQNVSSDSLAAATRVDLRMGLRYMW